MKDPRTADGSPEATAVPGEETTPVQVDLHAEPPRFPLVVDMPRLLLGPLTDAPEQLALRPSHLFFQMDLPRTALAVPPPKTTVTRSRARAPRIARETLPLPLRAPNVGKGGSLGTGPLTAREFAAAKRLPSLRMLPATRAACRDMPRPCPFVSCERHLYLDVHPETGAIKVNFPGLVRVDEKRVKARLEKVMGRVKVARRRGAWEARVRLQSGVTAGARWNRPTICARGKTTELARARLEAIVRAQLTEEHTWIDLRQMEETCSDDVAEQGPQTDMRVGRLLNLTLERARQLRDAALLEVGAKIDPEGNLVAMRRPKVEPPDEDDQDPEPGS